MSNDTLFRVRIAGATALFLCLAFTGHIVRAGETADAKTPAAEEEPDYKNWVELAIGGVITHGDRAQFEQTHRLPGGQVYGGISDLHYEKTIGKDVELVVDGHALFDNHDYDLTLSLTKAKVGYIRVGYNEFRSWYDGNGGFLSPNGTWFPPAFPEMHIDRGEAWIELGLRVPDWPEITFRYSHEFREGQKDSTTWGDTTLTGITPNGTRKIIPAFRDIDEKRDIFSLDISKNIGKTDVTLGLRYEHIDDNDSLNMERGAGQLPPVVAAPGAQRFATQHMNDNIDVFSGHAITETRFSDSLWFTTGYSYTTLENDVSGSRNFGTQYDAAFGEPVPTLNQRDHAYMDLAGMAKVQYLVFNGNLLWMPAPNLSVLTAVRYTHENQDTSSTYLALEPAPNVPPPGFHFGPPVPASGERTSTYDRFAERLELRYAGINDWVFYAAGEWEEESGHVFETQDPEELINKDTSFVGQKYTVGANWYPTTRLSLSARYYHKIADYDNDIFASTRQRLLHQSWNTDNANVRMTWRPQIPSSLGVLAITTRYDYVYTTIDGQWFSEGDTYAQQQTGKITKHIISGSLTWSPMARLYLQGEASYVLDQTDTPAASINLIPNTSPTVLNFHNDYWTVTAGIGFVLDDKTDLHLNYSYYHANDFVDNAQVAVPYGMGATESSISASISRQLTKKVRLLLQYTYYNYDDATSGGHNNYEAHALFSSLQFRF